MYEQRALFVDLRSGYYRIERLTDHDIIGPVDFGFREWVRARALCFGGGPFMGSVLPGSNRLIFTGHSPCWEGFYVSTMGGAALTFENVGIDYVSLTGRCPAPAVLVLRREGQEQVAVDLAPIDPVAAWRGNGSGETGFFALQHHLWDRFAGTFSSQPRILGVGPAALATDFGAIGSSKVDKKGLTHVDCWAGRGGLGSQMAREHNLFGIIFGGSFIDSDLDDRKLADVYFKKRYDMRMILKDKDSTRKYRYDPDLDTGGTLGVNFTQLKDKMFSFNYRSVRWAESERLELHRVLVEEHYLEQFNQETIANKQYTHCGESCLAVCKKMNGRYKKDYEPYETMGPNSAIFDQRAAEQVVWRCDSLGFDGIQMGGVISWLFELIDDGLVAIETLGLPAAPVFAREQFRVVEDSAHNADLACLLMEKITAREAPLDFSNGAREVAPRLAGERGELRAVLDRLVVNCAGERGWMVPNQYWVPGMLSPMPIMGKYFEYYGDDFLPPRVLGRYNAERMAQEIMLDNMGFCRFHRGWGEELLPEIFTDHWHEATDMRAHHTALVRRINAHNPSALWQAGRVIELLHGYLRRKAEDSATSPELTHWLSRFDADPKEAARDYWYEIRKGVDEALAEDYAPAG